MNKNIPEIIEALHFANVKELKEISLNLGLNPKGKKGEIISNIKHFLGTGKEKALKPFPKESKANSKLTYPLSPGTLILKGAYKNDLKTRNFLKTLIGNYFHFTSFGIDWINEKWEQGSPPTYQEFANFWKDEYQKRKVEKAPPKDEWAYINFIQKTLVKNPSASHKEITTSWKLHREKMVANALALLNIQL
ncbi:MAG: hypothetical protein J0H68_03405 [Sphingobacteriia bacterium]|nr:hypothetical protein [Sphingobacteriia bacterium]